MRRIGSWVVALVLACVLVFVPASPAGAAECYLEALGSSNNFRVVCTGLTPSEIEAGIVSGEVFVILPTETVTLPPLPPVTTTQPAPPPVTITDIVKTPGPTTTVTLVGPTSTATITQPGDTETFYLPGPARTVQGPVVTKTAEPSPNPTVTETETATETVTQIVTPIPEIDTPTDSNVLFDPPPLTVVETVGYSALALLLLCGLIVFGLWLGYILGYKDSRREEMKFLDALRDQFYYRGKHS